ncbi:unnamed protein product [Parascedosporium putredinis]|uniref:Uncharacterized protein n=1 Tax=Parascedosporium putredinis TaxID=1442378 RepID=A0A9P1MBY1_9PEZI|nr:unnamed protein product [Parascedosporium putredinis]CAI7997333.1 unnamed protein product [Parascedosporium putredinis]
MKAPFPSSAARLWTLFAGVSHLLPLVVCQPGCRTQTSYNYLSEDYPYSVSAVVNGTFSLIYLENKVAQSFLPEGYSFLESEAQEFHPLLLRATYVHDIRAPDDMVRNQHMMISFELPFVDALEDGKTPFRYVSTQFISTGTPSYAADIAEAYGVPNVIRAVYDPECDAYDFADPLPDQPFDGRLTVLRAYIPDGTRRHTKELYDIVTQPRFGLGSDGMVCGRTGALFGEDAGFSREVEIKGDVTMVGEFESLLPLFGDPSQIIGAYGVKTGALLVQDDFVPCEDLAQ